MAPRRAAAAAATQSMAQANQVAQAGPSGGSEPRKSSKAGTGVGLGVATAAPLRQDLPISPIVAKLRRNWQFAAVCQFLFTFDEAFGMSGFETEALERDLDGEDLGMLPDLVRRMLYTLTLDKNIDTKNWEHYLRMQYLARSPGNNPLGSMELSRPWAAMGLTQKVKALWSLCEWQLVDSERFRKLVKSEEEPEVWRIEPVGWDSQDNTYWLFDDNRLWVQHTEPPPPPKPKALPPAKKGSKRARAEARASRKSTADKATESPSRPASTATGAKRGRLSDVAPATPAKRARASESATPARPASARSSRRLRGAPGEVEGVWEAVPSDILKPSRRARNGRGSKAYAQGGSSSESDLSEPPDEDLNGSPSSLVVVQEEADTAHATANEDVEMADTSTTERPTNDSQLEALNGHASAVKLETGEKGDVLVGHASVDNVQDSVPQTQGKVDAHSEVLDEKLNGASSKLQDSNVAFSAHAEEEDGWIEFETVAVTRLEWEDIAVRFAKSKHPDEKAFHSYLQESVIPRVMADFDAVEKQRAVEAALASRKRSSRIAMKESEREERERDRAARLEMEERMARLRAEDKERRDREREANEVLKAREERAKEREERINAREREAEERAIKEIEAREARERMREDRARKREEIIANGGIPPKHDDPRAVAASAVEHGIEPTEDENWELACEVCGKAGVNLDDSSEIVCCESCGVWQHTDCWNAFDRSVRRPARDWDQIDFYCSKCKPPHPDQPWPGRSKPKKPESPRPRIKVKQLGPDPSQSPAPSPLTHQTPAPHGDVSPHATSLPLIDDPSQSPAPPTGIFGTLKHVSNGVHPAHLGVQAAASAPPAKADLPSVQQLHRHVTPQRVDGSPSIPQSAALASETSIPKVAPVTSTSSQAGPRTQTSPSADKAQGPARSPGAYTPRGTGGSGSASGSFPIKRAPLRSPLSGPHAASSNAVPGMNLGPARAGSPTPSGPPRSLGSVGPNIVSSSNALSDPLLQRQGTAVPQPAPSAGPGPTSGSLARAPPQSTPAQSNGIIPPASPRSGSVFGPSPPRLAYGSAGAAAAAASSQAALARSIPSSALASPGAPLPPAAIAAIPPFKGQLPRPGERRAEAPISDAAAAPAVPLASQSAAQAPSLTSHVSAPSPQEAQEHLQQAPPQPKPSS